MVIHPPLLLSRSIYGSKMAAWARADSARTRNGFDPPCCQLSHLWSLIGSTGACTDRVWTQRGVRCSLAPFMAAKWQHGRVRGLSLDTEWAGRCFFATRELVVCSLHSKTDPPRTRTWNLRLRRPTPYPLGQRATWCGACQYAFVVASAPERAWLENAQRLNYQVRNPSSNQISRENTISNHFKRNR